MLTLVQSMWETGDIPQQLRWIIVVLIPKGGGNVSVCVVCVCDLSSGLTGLTHIHIRHIDVSDRVLVAPRILFTRIKAIYLFHTIQSIADPVTPVTVCRDRLGGLSPKCVPLGTSTGLSQLSPPAY